MVLQRRLGVFALSKQVRQSLKECTNFGALIQFASTARVARTLSAHPAGTVAAPMRETAAAYTSDVVRSSGGNVVSSTSAGARLAKHDRRVSAWRKETHDVHGLTKTEGRRRRGKRA